MSEFLIPHNNALRDTSDQIYPGKLNTLKKQSIFKLFNINSCVREEQAPPVKYQSTSTSLQAKCDENAPCQVCNRCCYLKKWSSSNFIVRLPENLDKVIGMKLSAAEIPNTIYPISHTTKTNVFQIETIVGGGGDNTTTIIEVPSGNYTTEQLVGVINMMMNAHSIKLEANYDTISRRFYFKKTDDTIDYKLDFRIPSDDRNIKMNLGWMLGFRKALYCLNDYMEEHDVWGNGTDHIWPCKENNNDKTLDNLTDTNNPWNTTWPHGYIAEGILDISGPKYIFLVVNDFNNNVNNKYTSLGASGSNFLASNILARITTPNTGDSITYDDSADFIPKIREYFGPVSIDKLHIQIIDEFGRLIDFNNNDITLLLNFQCLYNL